MPYSRKGMYQKRSGRYNGTLTPGLNENQAVLFPGSYPRLIKNVRGLLVLQPNRTQSTDNSVSMTMAGLYAFVRWPSLENFNSSDFDITDPRVLFPKPIVAGASPAIYEVKFKAITLGDRDTFQFYIEANHIAGADANLGYIWAMFLIWAQHNPEGTV